MSAPLNAFCLMPADNAAHLDFMTGVLGLRVKRAEESFLAFDTGGVVVCLWESGHVCGQLGYRGNTVADCGATAILTLALPGEAAVAEAVAEMTGKKLGSVENMVAFLRCARVEGKVSEKYRYIGHGSCSGANLAFGGPQSCLFACIGLGECAKNCPFSAITMVGGLPHIDTGLCVGCGVCTVACPTGALRLHRKNGRHIPPKTQGDLYRNIMVERFGLLGALKTAVRVLSGRKA
mgnify:CR=1 FL=1